jgi:hypothetical protein
MMARKHPPGKDRNGEGNGLLKRAFAILGPGLITGAADDDPSGISTYSVAGFVDSVRTVLSETGLESRMI